jgi:hypothetical protein
MAATTTARSSSSWVGCSSDTEVAGLGPTDQLVQVEPPPAPATIGVGPPELVLGWRARESCGGPGCGTQPRVRGGGHDLGGDPEKGQTRGEHTDDPAGGPGPPPPVPPAHPQVRCTVSSSTRPRIPIGWSVSHWTGSTIRLRVQAAPSRPGRPRRFGPVGSIGPGRIPRPLSGGGCLGPPVQRMKELGVLI